MHKKKIYIFANTFKSFFRGITEEKKTLELICFFKTPIKKIPQDYNVV